MVSSSNIPGAIRWREEIQMTLFFRLSLIVVSAFALSAQVGLAEEVTLHYADPIGDSTGAIDVTSMTVVFDTETGDYTITLKSTAGRPFVGAFRVNVNLFNPQRLPDHSFFEDTVNDYDLTTPVTMLVLTGTHPSLLEWAAGDVVFTNTEASGGQNPPGVTYYRSEVTNFPEGFLTNEDTVAYGPLGSATIDIVTPVAPINVSRNVSVVTGPVIPGRERGQSRWTAVLTVTNRSRPESREERAGVIEGPLFVVLALLSPNATLLNGSGFFEGDPYILIPVEGLAPGDSISVLLEFDNAGGPIEFRALTYSGSPNGDQE